MCLNSVQLPFFWWTVPQFSLPFDIVDTLHVSCLVGHLLGDFEQPASGRLPQPEDFLVVEAHAVEEYHLSLFWSFPNNRDAECHRCAH